MILYPEMPVGKKKNMKIDFSPTVKVKMLSIYICRNQGGETIYRTNLALCKKHAFFAYGK